MARTARSRFFCNSPQHPLSVVPAFRSVKAELGSRGHSTETGVIMATASTAAGVREWEETYPARPRHVRDARHAVEGLLCGWR